MMLLVLTSTVLSSYIFAEKLNCPTADDHTYFQRSFLDKHQKKEYVKKYVLSKKDIKTLFDIGCNNGYMSQDFLRHGIDVLGVDASDNLQVPVGYPFKHLDIMKDLEVKYYDCTLFLSVYHHIFANRSKEVADKLFYKLLLRTKYLVFDCGTLNEKNRSQGGPIALQKKYFSSDKDLLNHFGLPYEYIGSWATGGGQRPIIAFEKKDFDEYAQVVDIFKKSEKYGLVSVKDCPSAEKIIIDGKQDTFVSGVFYYKLKLGDCFFLAKKYDTRAGISTEQLKNEVAQLYNSSFSKRYADFYGHSDKYGFIYEWSDEYSSQKEVVVQMKRKVTCSTIDNKLL